ncbi:MAG: porin family protein [Bacteroidales bacterium]|nr:porin family protein [Bacteroidales bacterium]
MKKLKVLFVAALAMVSVSVSAQQKGQIWLDGGIGFSSFSGEQGNIDKLGNSDFNINVSGNYMLTDKWSVGLGLGYEMTSADKSATPKLADKTNMFNIQVQGNYFMRLNNLFTWTPRAYFGIGFGSSTYEAVPANVEGDLSKMQFMIEPLNFQANFNNHLAFTFACDLATFGWSTNKETINNVDDIDNHLSFKCGSLSSNLGNLGLRLGFRYFF